MINSPVNNKNAKCQVFTPEDYVDILVSLVKYDNPYGRKILENSCGTGNILITIVKTYIKKCKKIGLSIDKIQEGLSNDIYGIEIDGEIYNKCISNLNKVLENEKIPRVNWRIYNCDFLQWESPCHFSYIIGNPPYITYQEIKPEERSRIRMSFKSCIKGKFDYCYAFIEKSIDLLEDDGKFAYLIPSSIFKTVFGKNIRDNILPSLKKIIDFSNYRIFEKVLIKSSIVFCDKKYKKDYFIYKNDGLIKQIKKAETGEKWCFKEFKTKPMKRFGDYFSVSHVVATLCNSVFILNNYIKNNNYIFSNGCLFEIGCIRDAASPKNRRYNRKEKIIFPYYYQDGKLQHYTEQEFKDNFPNTYNYLLKKKEILKKRKVDASALWFEYGRSQALSKINKEKLLVSTIISDNFEVSKLPKDNIPYAGMFILKKANLTLDIAKKILESKDFLNYSRNIGVPITGHSVRITSKDIMNYMFDSQEFFI